jgi:hypothetical protein
MLVLIRTKKLMITVRNMHISYKQHTKKRDAA